MMKRTPDEVKAGGKVVALTLGQGHEFSERLFRGTITHLHNPSNNLKYYAEAA